jgi:hypothetical protein
MVSRIDLEIPAICVTRGVNTSDKRLMAAGGYTIVIKINYRLARERHCQSNRRQRGKNSIISRAIYRRSALG